MKLLKLVLLLGVVTTLCSFGASASMTGLSSSAFLALFFTTAALGAYHLYARDRKARALAPVKIRREQPIVIRRRRPGQW